MDTVVNRALPSLHEGSLEIMLTVPLNIFYLGRTVDPDDPETESKVGKYSFYAVGPIKLWSRKPTVRPS